MQSSRTNLGVILGVILIVAGLLMLVGQVTGLTSLGLLWPLMIILIGFGFFIGMFIGGQEAGALAIPGSIISTIGLILFFQNMFDLWMTWSYAWALIIVAVGIGQLIWGAYAGRVDLRKNGWNTIQVGLTLFVIFGMIFSLIWDAIGVMQGGYGFFGVLLALLGLFLLLRRSILLMRHEASWDDRDLFWPVIMIGAGLVFFLYALGRLPIAQLTGLWTWWPLALIMIGLDWLIGRRWPVVGAALAILIVIVTLILMFDPALLRVF